MKAEYLWQYVFLHSVLPVCIFHTKSIFCFKTLPHLSHLKNLTNGEIFKAPPSPPSVNLFFWVQWHWINFSTAGHRSIHNKAPGSSSAYFFLSLMTQIFILPVLVSVWPNSALFKIVFSPNMLLTERIPAWCQTAPGMKKLTLFVFRTSWFEPVSATQVPKSSFSSCLHQGTL